MAKVGKLFNSWWKRLLIAQVLMFAFIFILAALIITRLVTTFAYIDLNPYVYCKHTLLIWLLSIPLNLLLYGLIDWLIAHNRLKRDLYFKSALLLGVLLAFISQELLIAGMLGHVSPEPFFGARVTGVLIGYTGD